MKGTHPLASSLGALTLLCLVASACSAEKRVPWPHAGIPRFEGKGTPTREQGRWSYWYPNGQLREQGTYIDGKRTGTWKQWFPNGQRANEGGRQWDADTQAAEREGPWIFWHENGQLRRRGSYTGGVLQGTWEGWNDAGDIEANWTGVFVDGLKQP